MRMWSRSGSSCSLHAPFLRGAGPGDGAALLGTGGMLRWPDAKHQNRSPFSLTDSPAPAPCLLVRAAQKESGATHVAPLSVSIPSYST